MRLKCPICGKQYDYESKICKECEDYATYNNLGLVNNALGEKWNCAMFLDSSNCVFGRRSIDNRTHIKPVELFEFKIGQATHYEWSIGLKEKEKDTIEALKLDEIPGFDKKLALYLVYE